MATILISANSETITLAVAFTLLLVTLLFALLGLCTSLCCFSNLLGGKSAFLVSLYIISTCALCLSGASGIASLSHDNPRVSSGAFGVVGISLLDVYMIQSALYQLEARRSYYYGLCFILVILSMSSATLHSLLLTTLDTSSFTAMLVSRTFVHVAFDLLIAFLLLKHDCDAQCDPVMIEGSTCEPEPDPLRRVIHLSRRKLAFSEYRLVTFQALSIATFILSGALPHQWLPRDAPCGPTPLGVVPSSPGFLVVTLLLLIRWLGVGIDLALPYAPREHTTSDTSSQNSWSIVSVPDARGSSGPALINEWRRRGHHAEPSPSSYHTNMIHSPSSEAPSFTHTCSWSSPEPSPTEAKSTMRWSHIDRQLRSASVSTTLGHGSNSPSSYPRESGRGSSKHLRSGTPPLLFGRHSTADLRQARRLPRSQAIQATQSSLGLYNASKASSTARSSVTMDLRLELDDTFARYDPSAQAIERWRKGSNEAMSRQSYDSTLPRSPVDHHSPCFSYTPRRKGSTDELGRISIVFEEDSLVMPNVEQTDTQSWSRDRHVAHATPKPAQYRRRQGSTSSQLSTGYDDFIPATPRARRPAMHTIDTSVSAPARMRSGTGSSIYYDPFPAPGSIIAATETSHMSSPPQASRPLSARPSFASSRAPSLSSPRRAIATLKKLKERASLSALVPDRSSHLSDPSDLSFACAGTVQSAEDASVRTGSHKRQSANAAHKPSIRVPKPAVVVSHGIDTLRRSPNKQERWWRSSPNTFRHRQSASGKRLRAASSPCPWASDELDARQGEERERERPSSCCGELEHRLPTPRPISPLSIVVPGPGSSASDERHTEQENVVPTSQRSVLLPQAKQRQSALGLITISPSNALGLLIPPDNQATSQGGSPCIVTAVPGTLSPQSDAYSWSRCEDNSFRLRTPLIGHKVPLQANEM